MPVTYVYRCEQGHTCEVRQSMKDDALTVCPMPDCDASAARVIQAPTVLYVGEGWTRKDGEADRRVEARLNAGEFPRWETEDYYSPGDAGFGPLPGM